MSEYEFTKIKRELTFDEKLKSLFVSEELTDVEFKVGSSEIVLKSHRLVLSLASDVFRAMFYGKLPEKDPIIHVNDVHPEAFRNILQYIYTNKVTINSFTMALCTAYAAKKYMLSTKLLDLCVQSAEGYIEDGNIWEAFRAVLLFDHTRLRLLVRSYLILNMEKICASQDFLNCPEDMLSEFLEHVSSYAIPEMLFNALVRWAANQPSKPQDMRTLLTPHLCHVRFLAMTAENFVRTVGNRGILTDQELKDICFSIARNRCVYGAPSWLNLNRYISTVGVEYMVNFSISNCKEVPADSVNLVASFQILRNGVFLKGVLGWASTTGNCLPPTAVLTYSNHATNFSTNIVCNVEFLKSREDNYFRCMLPRKRLLQENDSVTLNLHLLSSEENFTFRSGNLEIQKYNIQAGRVLVQTHPINSCGILKGILLAHVI